MDSYPEKMTRYYDIYSLLFDDPFILLPDIAENIDMSEKEVSHILDTMYSHKILQGPMIFVKPAENYPMHVYFLKVKQPLPVFRRLTEDHILYKSMGVGDWDIAVISSEEIEVSEISGFEDCVYHGEKGKTVCSKVSELDWEQCMKKMHAKENLSTKKTTVYEKISEIPWGKREWSLFQIFKRNIRVDLEKKECDTPESYEEWSSHLSEYAVIQPALYPDGVTEYWELDFLFCSQYQKQITDILGLLPTTVIFFSTGENLLVRTWVRSEYAGNVYRVLSHLKELDYFSEMYSCNSLFTG